MMSPLKTVGDRVVGKFGIIAGVHGEIIKRKGGCYRVKWDTGMESSASTGQLQLERERP